MAENRGKKFEAAVREAFEKVPDTSVIRLPDPTSGYLGIRNVSDYIVYHYPHQYFIECKSVHGNTLSIYSKDPKKKYGNITNNQWEGMLQEGMKYGVVAGVICWWIDHDITRFLPIQVLEYLRIRGDKSIRYDLEFTATLWTPSTTARRCPIIDITGKKKRVFFEYDMKNLFDQVRG